MMSTHHTEDSHQHNTCGRMPAEDPAKIPQSPPASTPQKSHIPQSDSGICLTPQSQSSVSSPQQTQVTHQPADHQENHTNSVQPQVPTIVSPANSTDSVQHGASLKQGDASTKRLRVGKFRSSDSRSTTPDQQSPRRSWSPKLSSSLSSGQSPDFVCQTKYLVLHFLQQSTNEQNLLSLSQNSLSTTSESEPRFKTHAQKLRERWQDNRSQSSPTYPPPKQKTRPLAKTKGSRSSPDLKDANFFKDLPPVKNTRTRRPLSAKAPKGGKGRKWSPKMPRKSPVQAVKADYIRSVSENTENSEAGTYYSDADDELDTSFDSSHQGSVTSFSFRQRMAQFHEQVHVNRLPTVQSETESVAEFPLNVAEESTGDPLEDSSASSILSLNMINVEQEPVTPMTHYARVSEYLLQMGETSSTTLQGADTSTADVTDTTLQNLTVGEDVADGGMDEVDSPPFHLKSHPEQATLEVPASDQVEEGLVSGGFDFEPHETNNEDPEEVEGAWGGTGDIDDNGGRQGQKADRSKLMLDLENQDTALVSAVQYLQQEIEEEMSSFETEYEEALQSLHSDHSGWHSRGLSQSRSFSPETAEAARILAQIGDEVQRRHFDNLESAVGRLLLNSCAGLLTYENFREAAMMALDENFNGWNWKNVAVLLLYSQHVALHLAQSGRRGLHRVINYTVQLLADTAADFIIEQGGWAGISAIGQSSSTSSPDTSAPISNPFLNGASATPASPDGAPNNRSQSAPDLTPAQRSTTPSETPQDCTDHATVNTVDAGCQVGDLAAIPADSLPAGTTPGSPESTGPGQDEKVEKPEEEMNSGDGVMSTVSSAVTNSSLLTRCAVSIGVLAVGAAVAFKLTH